MPNPPNYDPRDNDVPDERDLRDYEDDRALRDHPNLPAHRPPRVVGRVWQPEPVRPPVILRELPRLTWPERCAESIRFILLTAEHWLSSGGVMREWIRLNLRVAVCLLAAAVLVVPPVTFILESTAEWAALIAATARNVSGTILGLPPVVVALSSIYLLARFVHRRLSLRRRYPQDRHHDPYM